MDHPESVIWHQFQKHKILWTTAEIHRTLYNKIQIHKRFKRTLYSDKTQHVNFQDNPLYQALKMTVKQ